ncbi:Predicted dithiol-disulfide isomerase, DsbA family [Glycomyces sambucus]|uniref:Predicted dithiol-disulfide isomerase, DsbA family n=1 Tax=Glycomyces sambucus TaxID=380244 RepID=A0A1G9DE69_9ACTN|nr:DsbA family oxidoreductase [Glycomyces sambucus]SDK62201.1 Predicted dithiol-disulfide isomerase, DsbA family [Glycomyces sambucus]
MIELKKNVLRVDVWSDIACPWCYVGKARFDKAVEELSGKVAVEVRHRSFELDPNRAPGEVDAVVPMIAKKYGISPAQAQANEYKLGELAKIEGLEYRTEGRDHGNTFDLHRLLHLASDRGLEAQVWQAFYAANFADEASIFERSRVIEVAVAAGLDESEVVAVLDDPERYREAVRADEAEAAALGANGVPFFVIDEKYGVSGAQPTALFAEMLEKAWNEKKPALTTVTGADDAEACGPEGCAI